MVRRTGAAWVTQAGARTSPSISIGFLVVGFAILVVGSWVIEIRAADATKPGQARRDAGRELFEREWLAGDSRAHGGDGLGPVYNDSSCIACHNLGGGGGGGPVSKNVDLITASANTQVAQPFEAGEGPSRPGFLARALGSLVGFEAPRPAAPQAGNGHAAARPPARRRPDTTELIKAHPGFRTARSVVLHRFGTEPGYEGWRQATLGFGNVPSPGVEAGSLAMVQAQSAMNLRQQFTQNFVGEFVILHSQRNPTSLFGAGLIDAVPERAIEEAARVKHPGFPEIAGRVSRLKDRRVGRFGWKAQTASLSDFVLTACAVELGLEVPGHHQGGIPQKPDHQAKGLDLDADECSALVAYVQGLPRPVERKPATEAESREIAAGTALFSTVGCATCHAPRLGGVEGIYGDLLLHDLGPQLGDTGQYGVFDPGSSEDEPIDEAGPIAGAVSGPAMPSREALVFAAALGGPTTPPGDAAAVETAPDVTPVDAPAGGAGVIANPAMGISGQAAVASTPRPKSGPASRFEWRTPPLWGFRDSGPYLHDGRAETLDQAVALHGGEAARIAQKFFSLKPGQRAQVEAFLKSLTAPDPAAARQVASRR